MPYTINNTYALSISITPPLQIQYTFSQKHRGAVINDEISKWLIDFNQEASCFISSMADDYIDGKKAWGFIKANNGFLLLGEINIELNSHDLRIAKFTEDNNGIWHGYPCYLKRKADKPSKKILQQWVNNASITKKAMSKISSYQKCSL